MSIAVTCGECKKSFPVKGEFAGKRGKCPHCSDVISKVNQSFEEAATQFFDTHPAGKDRVAAAHEENAPGIFRLDQPATVLFYNLPALSRNVTWDFYREIFGPQFKPSEMHPTDDLLARFRKTPYPFDHAKGKISISEYMLAEPPLADDPGAILDAARAALEALTLLYVRLVARLAEVAEEVEKALGLKPLRDPAREQDAPKEEP